MINADEKENKIIFLVDADPFPRGKPEEAVDWYIYPRPLVEERVDVYITQGTSEIERFPRELYTAFDTRDEALLHLERIVLNKMQELEDELSHWQQFNRSIEMEIFNP